MRLRWLWSIGAVLISACASVQTNTPGWMEYQVEVNVENNKLPNVDEPLFQLYGQGNQFWLGRVGSSSSHKTYIDRDKFIFGECFITKVTITGKESITYPQFCWMGEPYITITLNEITSTSTAWSHR